MKEEALYLAFTEGSLAGDGYFELGYRVNLPDLKEFFDLSEARDFILPMARLPWFSMGSPYSFYTFPEPKLSILAGMGSFSSLSLPACANFSAKEM